MAYLDENGLEHFWGKIKDHVSSAIAPKANDADVLHKTGTETVSGEKVFSGSQTTPSGNASALIVVKDPDLVKGETPATNHYLSLGFIDSTGDSYAQDAASRLAVVEYKSPSEADPESYMQMADRGFNGGGIALLRVGRDKDNIQYAAAPATSEDRTGGTDIVTRGYMEASEWNWQKTKKKGAVTFKPVPESDLEPVVDFVFTETPPAEGEKGPENPSTITGVSQTKVTRCGKNLCPIDKISMDWSVTGLTVSANTNDGYISISGTATTSASVASIYLRYVSGNNNVFAANGILRGETYTFSLSGDAPSSVSLNLFVKSTATTGWVNRVNITSGHSQTYTIPETAYEAILRLDVTSGSVVDCNCYVQVEKGSIATSFEPYSGTDYTIQLGDTYYGGSLDVATGVMTVTHWKFLINENCNYFYNAESSHNSETHVYVVVAIPSLPASSVQYSKSKSCCDCLSFSNTAISGNSCIYTTTIDTQYIANKQIGLILLRSTIGVSSSSTAAEINLAAETWFTEHPAAFVVGFSNSAFFSSVQLTPTQIRSLPALDKYEPRVNMVYTDQEAVQVGHQRFANYVDLTTDQTIEGEKVFRKYIRVKDKSFSASYGMFPYDTYSSRADVLDSVAVFDNNDKRLSLIRTVDKDSNGNRVTNIYTMPTSNSIPSSSVLTIGLLDVDGAAIGYAQAESTPEYEADGVTKRTSGKDIVTRDWIPKDTRIVHTTGNETIAGTKTFSTSVVSKGQFISKREEVDRGVSAPANSATIAYIAGDKNGKSLAMFNANVTPTQTAGQIQVWDFSETSSSASAACTVGLACQTGTTDFTFRPFSDNNIKLGHGSSRRWSVVYAGTGTINTSDERLKQAITLIPDEVLDAWDEVRFCQFKMNDSVAEKGENARIHSGLIAQRIDEIFSRKGLDASKYGLFCHDSWNAEPELRNDDGTVSSPALAAGDQYSLRYEEALCMEAAYMRRENARLKKRIADLEERLAALELKIS